MGKSEDGKFKLNFDGFLINGKASTDVVIRDEHARVIYDKGEKVQCYSVVGAEAHETIRGIKEALKLKIKDLIIEDDNLCVINALKGGMENHMEREYFDIRGPI